MQKKAFFQFVSLNLVFSVFFFTLPSQSWAMFIPSGQANSAKQSDLSTIQKTLESQVIKQRIMDYGLTPEEAMARISSMSDDQIHELAKNLDSLQAGGDGVEALIFLVLVAIVVVLILQLTGHRVIVR